MAAIGKLKSTPLPFLEMLLEDERMRGFTGADGERGKDGERGRDGSDGSDGLNGRDGLPGQDGQNGLDGSNGVDGVDGEAGKDGKDGKRGLKGLRGLRGLKGRAGKAGSNGKDGRAPKHQVDTKNGRIRFERPDGTWGAWVEIKQKVKHEVYNSGGGGAKLTNALQDIEILRRGGYPDYSRIKTTTVDMALTDAHRIVVAKDNAVTITLPPAATYYNAEQETGIIYSIVNDSENEHDIIAAAVDSELIDSANTWTVPPGASPKIVTDGTKWHVF